MRTGVHTMACASIKPYFPSHLNTLLPLCITISGQIHERTKCSLSPGWFAMTEEDTRYHFQSWCNFLKHAYYHKVNLGTRVTSNYLLYSRWFFGMSRHYNPMVNDALKEDPANLLKTQEPFYCLLHFAWAIHFTYSFKLKRTFSVSSALWNMTW